MAKMPSQLEVPIVMNFTINMKVPVFLDGAAGTGWQKSLNRQLAIEIELALQDLAGQWKRVREDAL